MCRGCCVLLVYCCLAAAHTFVDTVEAIERGTRRWYAQVVAAGAAAATLLHRGPATPRNLGDRLIAMAHAGSSSIASWRRACA